MYILSQQESQELEITNKSLRNEIKELEEAKESLKRMLRYHDDRRHSCPKKAKLSMTDDAMDSELELVFEDGQIDLSEEIIEIVM